MQKLTIDESKIDLPLEKQVKVRNLLINVPLKYRCTAVNTIFPIPSEKARDIINCSKIKPYEVVPGKSLLCITFFNFHSGPVGPYTEISLSIPVRYKPKFNLPTFTLLFDKVLQKVSFFVFSLAQSTKIAIEHGLAITGYPRYSTSKLINVEFKEDDNSIYIRSVGEGREIIKVKIRKPIKEKIKKESYQTYLIKEGKIFLILMESYGIVGKTKMEYFRLGDHELANFLKKLDITPTSIDTRYYRDTIKIIHNPVMLEEV